MTQRHTVTVIQAALGHDEQVSPSQTRGHAGLQSPGCAAGRAALGPPAGAAGGTTASSGLSTLLFFWPTWVSGSHWMEAPSALWLSGYLTLVQFSTVTVTV